MTMPTLLNDVLVSDDYANNLSDTASPIAELNVGDSRAANIETLGDTDLFAIHLTQGSHYSFGVQGSDTHDGTLADPYLTVLDASGAVIASDDDSGIYNNALLNDFVAPTTDVFYLMASGNEQSIGSYKITTQDNSNPASYNLTGSVFIIGTFEQGQTLFAASNLVDLNNNCGGTTIYHWWANGVEIATGSSYVLTELQVGMNISVTASYSSFYSSSVVSVSSSVSNTTVINVNDSVVGEVIISGSYTQGQTLTASNTFYDADGLGNVSYSWYVNNVYISTSNTYVLTQYNVNQSITVIASYTDLHGTVESKSFDTTSNNIVVTNVNDAPVGTVTINGTLTQGQTLTASNNLTDADGLGTINYTWQVDNATVAVGNSFSLTEAQVGKSVQVIASYTDLQGTTENVSSNLSAVVANSNDAPVGLVVINGTVTQGQTLTASNTLTDADGLGAISYVWQANNITIGTGDSYILTKNEVDKSIKVIANYTDGHGTLESVSSQSSALVSNINSPVTGNVTISGVLKQGQIITANNTLADADGLGAISYSWQANNINIGTGNSFTLTEAQVGKTITVTASYTDGHKTQESVTSKVSNVVANVNDVPTGGVSFSGTLTEGQKLTASNDLADADGLGAITYSWKANGIVVATGNNYTLTSNEVGKKMSVTASYIDGHNTSETKTSVISSLVQGINHLPTGKVSITGTVTQGQVLTASNTLADVDGLGTISYQWKADNVNLAKGATYKLTEAQVGKIITVTASYTDGHNILESVSSPATRAVVNVNDNPTGKVTISGVATQNQTLTAVNTLADADGLGVMTYTWKAGTLKIGTGNSIVLAEAQVGKIITVTASYTDGHGKLESVTSLATRAVINVNDEPTGTVVIKGNAIEGNVLTASHTLKDADGLTAITYSWKTGATLLGTGTSYTLTSTETGKKVTVTAQYTDGHGTVEKVVSAATSTVINNDPDVKVTALHGLSTCENDGKGTSETPPKSIDFDVSLKTKPLQNVTLNFASSDLTEGVVTTGASLTFTATNWNTPQKLVVTGVNDYLADNNMAYQINVTVSTIDVFYKNLSVTPIQLTNLDDGRDVALKIYGDIGGTKKDVLNGLDGNDLLYGLNDDDNLSGGIGNDTLYGGYGGDNLFGNDGNDYLWGEQDADHLEGGIGNDTLDGGTGADTMIGGAGNDTYYLGYDAQDFIDDQGLTSDVDTVIMPYQLTSYTLPTGIENGTIADGTQDSSLTGNTGNNTLTGNAGNNTLNGGAGRDSLFGGIGDDVLDGGAGNNSLDGGIGRDTLFGGVGDDVLNGGDGDNSLSGGLGRDSLFSGTGNDVLDGGDGDNNLSSGGGRDSLFGGTGNDVLDSGAGNDTITGGAGQDSFVFDTALTGNLDSIIDFNIVDDTFRLSKSIFTALTLGNLSIDAFKIAAVATDNSDRIIYNKSTGAIYYDDDGIGANASIQIVTIGVNLALTAADFVVIA